MAKPGSNRYLTCLQVFERRATELSASQHLTDVIGGLEALSIYKTLECNNLSICLILV